MKKKIIIGVIVGFVVLGVIGAIVGEGEDPAKPAGSVQSTRQPVATAAPEPTVPPPPSITAEKLYAEREANAARFDQNYKGKWVTITGRIGEVDGGEVRLVTDPESYRILGQLMLNYVALNDLPTEVQVSLNKDDEFTAVCRVGNYIMGTMQLNKCQ